MSENKLAPRRIYSFDLPVHIPFFAIGAVKRKFKQIGVWDDMPARIKQKTTAAGWGGLTITKKDLDSLPDDVWLTIARALRLEWRQPEPTEAPSRGAFVGAEA
ncbi:MAG: hypothetical protein AB7S93_16255 [Xanthobacteraceae bacterium]